MNLCHVVRVVLFGLFRAWFDGRADVCASMLLPLPPHLLLPLPLPLPPPPPLPLPPGYSCRTTRRSSSSWTMRSWISR